MHPHFLGANHMNLTSKHFVFFDTETTSKEIDGERSPVLQTLKLGWMIYVRVKNGEVVLRKEYKFIKSVQFWNALESLKREHGATIYVMAFNIDYDANVVGILHYPKERGWKINKPLWGQGTYIWEMRYKNAPYIFLDIGNFLGKKTALKNIGEAVGLPKFGVDASDLTRYSEQQISDYCFRDTEIIIEYFFRWYDFIRKHNSGRFAYTLAGQCLAAFRHGYPEIANKIKIHGSAAISEFERYCYHGGMVEKFRNNDEHKKIWKLDVNSFHPWIMRNKSLPYELVGGIWTNNNMTEIDKELETHLGIFDADIYCPKRLIPVKIKGKGLVFPVGNFRAGFTSIEYERLKKIGGRILKIYRFVSYKHMNLFKGYMDRFYKEKVRYKKEGNKVFTDMAKYFMNSLEGKFAQHSYEWVELGDSDKSGVELQIGEDGKRFYIRHFNGKAFVVSGDKKEGYNSFISISAFIRAWTRVYLSIWIEMVEDGGGQVFYCDTDSLFIDETGYNVLRDADLIDDDELGKLAVEDVGIAEFRNLKDYTMNGDRKTKGIRKDAVLQPDGSYSQQKFLRTRGLMQRGINEGVVVLRDYRVKMKGVYKKGKDNGIGNVKPLNLKIEPKQLTIEDM